MSFFRTSNPIWTVFDVDGKLAVGAQIFTYRSVNKTERKATFVDPAGEFAAPNPITLDSIGQISYEIYWNDDEKYYIEIYDAQGRFIRSFDGFPSTGGGGGSTTVGIDFQNHLMNGQFRFWYKTLYEPLTATPLEIAPYWTFQKSNASAIDKITINRLNLGDATEGSPIYEVNYICTSQGAGELYKDFIQKISDVRTFEQSNITLSGQFYSDSAKSIGVYLRQNFGTGGSPSPQIDLPIETFNLTGGFREKKYGHKFVPSVGGKTLGTNGDDYIAIVIRMPLDSTCNIKFTNLYLASTDKVLPYPRLTKEEEDSKLLGGLIPQIAEGDEGKAIVVGDDFKYNLVHTVPVGAYMPYAGLRLPVGFLYCRGATYSISQDAKRYERLYNSIEGHYGYGLNSWIARSGSNNVVIANTIADAVNIAAAGTSGFIVTTPNAGLASEERFKIIACQAFAANELLIRSLARGVTIAANKQSALAIASTYRAGSTAVFDYTRLVFKAASAMAGGQYFFISSPTINYAFWYAIDGAGGDPAITGRTSVKIDILSTDTAEQVAVKTMYRLGGYQITNVQTVAATAVAAGSYFTINTTVSQYYVWFKKDSVGTDPKVAGRLGMEVDILTADTPTIIATKVAARLNKEFFQVPNLSDAFIRGRTSTGELYDSAGTRIGGTNQGSIEFDEVISHTHAWAFHHDKAQDTTGTGSFANNPSPDQLQTVVANVDTLHGGTLPAGQGGSETRPYNIYSDYIIKY